VAAAFLAAAAACREPSGGGPLVVVLGDSLTAGWRISRSEAFPAHLEKLLRERGRAVRVVNAGVSGETVAQGRARLPRLLARRPQVLVVALGVNDGLRGLPLDAAEAGLRAIVSEARAAGARVLLVGMRLPRAADPDYARRFADLYPRVASDLRVPLVPFLLEGVAGRPELHFPDGIHPIAGAQPRLAENVRPHLELVLAEVERDAR
jgi:acyl-CoA thioesterase-1